MHCRACKLWPGPFWVCPLLQADLATYNQTLYSVTGAIIDPQYCNQTQIASRGAAGTRRVSVALTLTLTAVAAAAALAAL